MTDDPGNVIGTVNSANQIVEQMRYTPFGKFEVQNITVAPLAYMGALLDEGYTYYLRNRWYDPDLQRFLSEDPIGLAGGINPYTFIGNSPMEGRDPSGLCPQPLQATQDSNGQTVYKCPGGSALGLSGLTATATPKTQTVNVGSTSRGYTGMAFAGSSGSGRYGSIGSGGGGEGGGIMTDLGRVAGVIRSRVIGAVAGALVEILTNPTVTGRGADPPPIAEIVEVPEMLEPKPYIPLPPLPPESGLVDTIPQER